MKKLLTLLLLVFCLNINFAVANAQDKTADKEGNGETEQTQSSTELELEEKINLLLPSQNALFDNSKKNLDEPFRIADGDLEQGLAPRVLRILIRFSTLGFFLFFTYAGLRLLLSRGNEETLTKTKDLIIQGVVGAILITASFGIVYGIIRFFDTF